MASKTLFAICFLFVAASASKLASDVVYDMYAACLKDYSVSCVKPKALNWINQVAEDDVIQITEDLSIVKDPEVQLEEQRGPQDIFDKVDNFISSHRLVAKMPAALKEGGALADLVPRSLVPEDVNVPLVAEGRGKVKKAKKYIMKAILPFLLGLKFKIAVVAPIAFAFMTMLTWKAMTLGVISLILNGAMVLFRLAKPKVVNYEVVHYPQHHHLDHHHVDHVHVDNPAPAPTGWDHAGYGRQLDGEQLAYRAYQ